MQHDKLLAAIDYNPDTGELTWKACLSNRIHTGAPVGYIAAHGYRYVTVFGVRVYAQQLIWFYMTGTWPKPGHVIDHINQNKQDNRWSNLREITVGQNNQNLGKPVTNKSGHKGVSWDSLSGNWRAQISVNGKSKYLGLFATPTEAAIAYNKAKSKLHPFSTQSRD